MRGEGQQLAFPLLVPGKRHLADGGRLVYTYVKGGIGYRCEVCGKEYLKRGYSMPFPKGAQHAKEVAKGISLDEVCGITYLLESYIETSDPEDDIRAVLLYCKTEDNQDIILGTTSDVVRKQLKALDGHMPVLITPEKPGRYFTIY